jgi:dGTPase
LTHPTLAAMMKYPWGSNHSNYKRPKEEGGGKLGYFEPEEEYAKETAQAVGLVPDGEGGWHRHPLAYLVEAADDIAYRIVDLEDGVDMGDLSFEEFETLFTDFLQKVLKPDASSMVKDLDRLNDPIQRISYLRSTAMVVLADQVVRAFRENEETIVEGEFRYKDPVPKAKVFYRPLLGEIQNTDTRNFIDTIGQIPKERMYDGSRKLYTEITYYRVIHGLLDAFSKAVLAPEFVKHEHLKKLMGRDKPEPSWSRDDTLRGVVDLVSGMTDRFALGMFRQLEGISLGNMTPAPLRRTNLKQKDVEPKTA